MSPKARIALLSAGLAVGVVAAWIAFGPGSEEPAPGEIADAPDEPGDEDARAADEDSTAYGVSLRNASSEIESLSARAEQMQDSWMACQMVAGAYMGRAKLTGDYDDWIAARTWLDRAFERAPEGAGPRMTRVSLNFSLHRIAEIEPDLAAAESAVIVDDHRRAEISARRGDVHFHSGRYTEAFEAFREAYRLHETTGNAYRIAQYYWKIAEFTQAEQYLLQAEQHLAGDAAQTRAFVHLQRGLLDLDRGRYDDAMAHYEEANAAFDGWWLIEEHMAEIDAVQGRTDEAMTAYRDLIERTGSPEFMDALAEALEPTDAEESARWAASARTEYERRLEQLPEASYGHALEHFLGSAVPEDVERTVELAEANHELRPGGEAKQLLVQAYVKAGRADDARRVLDELLETPWSTAESHAIASMVLAAAGDGERAAAERVAAEGIRADVMEDFAWMAEALAL